MDMNLYSNTQLDGHDYSIKHSIFCAHALSFVYSCTLCESCEVWSFYVVHLKCPA